MEFGTVRLSRDAAESYLDFSVSDCGGTVSMYANQGFEIMELPDGIVARKRTKKQSKKGQCTGMFGKNPAIK